jgi:uncharacterized protein with GYD domain
MKKIFCVIVIFFSINVWGGENIRHFLFIGEPNASAWQYLMDNPQDRQAATKEAMRKIGGEILQYWFGLGDGKNYIIVRLPDDNTIIQAVYLMRKPSGLLDSYEVIELMSSADMVNALNKSKEFLKIEKESSK